MMTISPPHAWTLARLVANLPLNGELDALPEPYRTMGGHLAGLPPETRKTVWPAMLSSRTERADLVHAMAAVKPEGPQPEAGAIESLPVVMRAASEIEPCPVEWLWEPRLPLGMLSLFAGDPKVGKSFVTIAVAAAVSRGAPLPLDNRLAEPGSAIIMSAEDDPARTIVPRLESAGAVLERVHILEAVRLEDGTELLAHLRANIAIIERAAASFGDCRIIVIDPVTAYLGGVDDHKNAELRGVLSPLKRMAERLNVAIVLVTHLNKGTGTNGKHRVTGSIAYVGACRANFLFVRDRDDSTGRRVLMLDNGCNLAASVPTLAYRLEDRGDGPAVEWDAEPVAITTEEALQAETEAGHERSEGRECDEWLRETLAVHDQEANEVIKAGRDAGFSRDQVNRAKRRIGIKPRRAGFGSGSKWVWSLPGQPPTRPEDGTEDGEDC
jgi:hypothetical protein